MTESQIRGHAAEYGLQLRKSRSRTPSAPGYGRYALEAAGISTGYVYTLDEVEKTIGDCFRTRTPGGPPGPVVFGDIIVPAAWTCTYRGARVGTR